MSAQPDLSPRGWNGGPLKYGASPGRPSYVLSEHFTADDAVRAAQLEIDRMAVLGRCLVARMIPTDTRTDDDIREARQECLTRAYSYLALAVSGALTPVKMVLRRIAVDAGGYDAGGAYWGSGQPLYWAGPDNGGAELWFRAADREAAKAHVRETFPNATFYR